jgi:hypothetical protein
MVGPEHLLAMTGCYSFKRRAALMIGGERVVIPRVPVLSQDNMAEGSGDTMNHRYNILAARYRQGAPITEVILHIDYKQNVTVNQLDSHRSSSSVSPGFTISR